MIDFAQLRQTVGLRNFVEHVGIPLRQEGELFRGKCPFHEERRGASLIIYPDQRWFCQGKCHRGGDVVHFAQFFWQLQSPIEAAKILLGQTELIEGDHPFRLAQSLTPKWPKRDLNFIDKIVRSGISLYDLIELSPFRFESSDFYTEDIIDLIFPSNPLLCIGKTDFEFATRRREIWRGALHRFPLMVPSPMRQIWEQTQSGKWSQHSKKATAGRIYLVIEFDFSLSEHNGNPSEFAPLIKGWNAEQITVADACAALLWHLRKLKTSLPFLMAVHSGGKSIHGWFLVYPAAECQIWPFMRYAYQVGADHVTWCKSQFIRIPGGTRQDGRRQFVFFFDPKNAVKTKS